MKLVKWHSNKPGFYNENWNNFFNDEFFKPATASQPAVNIRETENSYSLEVAAPGLKKDDFKIELDKNILNISVTREKEQKEEQNGYSRREFHYSSFKRSFVIPETVDAEHIAGAYENGILNVQLPKKAEVKAAKRAIEVA